MDNTQDYLKLLDLSNVENKVSKNLNTFREYISSFLNEKDSLNIIHHNIRSISKNFDELIIYLQNIEYKFDFIILSETWNAHTDHFDIKGYNCYSNDSFYNQNDGCIIYVNKDIQHTTNIIKCNDLRFLRTEFQYHGLKFAISSIYKPPPYNKDHFIEQLEIYLTRYCNLHNEIFCGDINLDILNQNDKYVTNYLNLLNFNGFNSYINSPTRIEGFAKTCLDHIFVKSIIKTNNFQSIVSYAKITDHLPVSLQIKFNKNSNLNNNVIENSHFSRNINFETLSNNLGNINWDNIFDEDIDISVDKFLKVIKTEIKKVTTYKRINSKNKKRHVWVTRGLLTSINIRDRLYYQHTLQPENQQIKEKYNYYKKKIAKLIIVLKNKFYIKKINNSVNEPGKLWDIAKEIINKSNKNNVSPPVTITPDSFNDHFISIGDQLASVITCSDIEQNTMINDIKINPNTCFLTPITSFEIIDIINK